MKTIIRLFFILLLHSFAFGQNVFKLTGNENLGESSFLGSTNKSDLIFKTNSIERIRITSDGDIIQTGYVKIKDSMRITGPLYIGENSLAIEEVFLGTCWNDQIRSNRNNISLGGDLGIFSDIHVGIGITCPWLYKLQIHDQSGTSGILNPVQMAFTNEDVLGGLGTGVTATDGFLVGIESNGEARLIQQEDQPITIWENGLERMRITNTVSPIDNLTTNLNRIGIGERDPVLNPQSLIHFGFNLPGIPLDQTGWRDWMDVGIFGNSNFGGGISSGQTTYWGFKREDVSSPEIWPGNMDVVIGWGRNADAGEPRLRFIYTSSDNGQVPPNPSGTDDGLELMRMYSDYGQFGFVGIGEKSSVNPNPYSGGSIDPQRTLEINSPANSITPGESGLRFTDLTENSNSITGNATNTVLSVNQDGDVILVTDQTGGGGGGTPLVADNGTWVDNSIPGSEHVELGTTPLHHHTVVPLADVTAGTDFNLYFSGQNPDVDKIGIGYNATVTPPFFPDLIGRLNVLQSSDAPLVLPTLSTSIFAENDYTGSNPALEVVSVRAYTPKGNVGTGPSSVNIGVKSSALNALTNFGGVFEGGFSTNPNNSPTTVAANSIGIQSIAHNATTNTAGIFEASPGAYSCNYNYGITVLAEEAITKNTAGTFEAFSTNAAATDNTGIICSAKNAKFSNVSGEFNSTSETGFPGNDNYGILSEVTEAQNTNNGGRFAAYSNLVIANDNTGLSGTASNAKVYNKGGYFEANTGSAKITNYNIGVQALAKNQGSGKTCTGGDFTGTANLNSVYICFGVNAEGSYGKLANYGGRFVAKGFSNSHNYGVYASAVSPGWSNYGIYARASGAANNWAGWFQGDVLITNSLTVSDSSVKENISDITNAITIINQLKPHTFNFKYNEYEFLNLPHNTQYGLISQEVEKVIPDIIKNTTIPAELDSAENVISPELNIKTLNYNGLIPILVKGVQELDSSLNNLATAPGIWSANQNGDVILTDYSKNVGIGTPWPNAKLTVEGNTTLNGILNVGADANVYGSIEGFFNITSHGLLHSYNGLSVYGEAQPNITGFFYGNVLTTGQYLQASDSKFKTNIEGFSNAIGIINQLDPVTFNYKTDEYDYMNFSDKKCYGLIAQDVEQVIPELVSNNTHPEILDTAGNVVIPEFDYKGLDYEALIPILIQAVKELNVDMQEQQAMIDSLKEQMAVYKENYTGDGGTMAPQTMNGAGNDNSQDVTLSNTKTIILNQNAPNPFAEQTTITYVIPEEVMSAQMVFAEANGVVLSTVDITNRGAGEVKVYAADLSSGAYIYYLVADGKVAETKTMICSK